MWVGTLIALGFTVWGLTVWNLQSRAIELRSMGALIALRPTVLRLTVCSLDSRATEFGSLGAFVALGLQSGPYSVRVYSLVLPIFDFC